MKKRTCEFCGKKLDKNDIFCKSCGNKVEKDEEVKDAVIEDPNKVANSNFLLIVIIILLIVMVGLGIYLMFF